MPWRAKGGSTGCSSIVCTKPHTELCSTWFVYECTSNTNTLWLNCFFWVFGGGSRKYLSNERRAFRWCCLKCLSEQNKSKNKGLISADRRTKPTLMLTIPHSYKVVYNGFISSNVWNCDKIRCWARRPTRMRVTSEEANNIAFQHGFWLRGVQS